MRDLANLYREDRDAARAQIAATARPIGELIATLSDVVDQPDRVRVEKARAMVAELHTALGSRGSIDWATGEVHRPPILIEHTPIDREALVAAGVDPDTVQARERAVPCAVCRVSTYNHNACCSDPAHYQPPAAVRRAVA